MQEQSQTLGSRLVKGGLGLSAIALASSALSLLVGLLVARALGPESYGFYAFAGTVIALLAIPAQMGLPRLLSRDVAAYLARSEFTLLRGLQMWSQRFALFVPLLVGVFVGGGLLLASDRVPALDPATFAIALLMLPLLGLAGRDQGCLSGLRRVVRATWPTSILKPAVTLLCLGVVFSFSANLTSQLAMWINVFSILTAAIVIRVMLIRFWPSEKLPRDGQNRWREWSASLVPFGLLAAVSLINAKTDMLMLGFLTSAEEVGRYGIAVQGALLVSFALTAFNGVLAPNIAHVYASGEVSSMQRILNRSTAALLPIALLIAGTFFFYGEALISILFGEAYLAAYVPLVILAAGQLINVAFGSVGQFLTMTGHEKTALRALCVSAVINVFLNALLIPPYGGVGAAVATSLSVVLWNVLLSIGLYRRLGLTPGPIRL